MKTERSAETNSRKREMIEAEINFNVFYGTLTKGTHQRNSHVTEGKIEGIKEQYMEGEA